MEPHREGNAHAMTREDDWTWIESADSMNQPSPPSEEAFETAEDRPPSAPPRTSETTDTGTVSAANTSACQSPKSEKVADMVLEQPLLPRSEQRVESPVAVAAAAASAAAAAAAVAAAASVQREDQQQQQQQQQQPVPRSSPARGSSLAALTSAAVSSWLSASSELAWLAVEEAKQDFKYFMRLLDQARLLTHAGLQHLKGAISLWVEGIQHEAVAHADHIRDAACSCIKWAMEQRVAHSKDLQHVYAAWKSPPWALLSVGAVTALSTVAIGSLVWTNHSLSHQLRTRDRELATLFLHIGNLQETLHSSHAAVPIMQLLMQPGTRTGMISSLV